MPYADEPKSFGKKARDAGTHLSCDAREKEFKELLNEIINQNIYYEQCCPFNNLQPPV